MNLQEQFIHYVRKEKFWTQEDRAVLAVSGGVDSMVLAYLMTNLPEEIRPHLTIAHVNHQLREESNEEELFVKQWTKDHNLPFYCHKWNKEMHPETGIEEASRKVRYTFFEEVLSETESTLLLTAHHADDQAETIAMKLTRGGVLDQLTGIKSVRPFATNKQHKIIRPFLPFTKRALYTFAHKKQIPYQEDATNQLLDFSRNRYRNQIFPLLEKENERVKEHIVAFAEDLTDVLSVLQPILSQKMKGCITKKSGYWEIDTTNLLNEPLEYQRLILGELLKQIGEHSTIVFKKEHRSLLLEWMTTALPNSHMYLPDNWIAEKEYDIVRIRKKHQEKKSNDWVMYLRESEWQTLPKGEKLGLIKADDYSVQKHDKLIYLDPDQISFPLLVRHRKAGDRIKLKGSGGTKKIKDIFIDQKVPARKREEAYIVEDANGRIVWVIDYKQSMLSLEEITDKISYILVYRSNGSFNRKKKES